MKKSFFGKFSTVFGATCVAALLAHASAARADVATYTPPSPQPYAQPSAPSYRTPVYAPAGQQIAQPVSQPVANANPYYAPSPVAAPSVSAPVRSGLNMAAEPVVDGFADQVPLTVALQQILPQGYGYTLGDGVNPGQLVSWRGGRPWNTILQDMLASSGLGYSANNNLITVNATGASPTVVAGNSLPPVAPAPVAAPAPVVQPQAVYAPPVQQPDPVPAPVYMAQDQQMQQPAPQPEQTAPQPQPDAAPAAPQLMQPQPLQIENPAIFVPQVWEARPGRSLREQLQDWCNRVGAELHWEAEYDYPVQASMSMTGTFEEAVRVLLTGFGDAKPTPRARLHYNPAAGQSILIVEATGNNYGE